MSETLVFIDPDGTEWPLVPGPCPPDGLAGFYMPPAAVATQATPGVDGEDLLGVRFEAREVTVPMIFEEADEQTLVDYMRAFMRSASPRDGVTSVLRRTDPDGNQRDLDVLYLSGLEMQESWGSTRMVLNQGAMQKAVAVFKALDTFWRDPTATVQVVSMPSQSNLFFPIFPLDLNPSELVGNVVFVNSGDVEAYPVWTITGPANTFELHNLTTGRSLTGSTVLAAGDTLVVDTWERSVTLLPSSNRFGQLVERDLWPFEPGSNTVRIVLPDFDDGVTTLTVSWVQRYLTR